MKKYILFFLLLYTSLFSLETDKVGNFFYSNETLPKNLKKNFDFKELNKLKFQKMKTPTYSRKVRWVKIELNQRDIKNPYLLIPQIGSIYNVFTEEGFVGSNYKEDFKDLDIKSYKSAPDIFPLQTYPNYIFLEILDNSLPFSNLETIEIDSQNNIKKLANKNNYYKLLNDKLFFFQAGLLIIIGIFTIFLFYLIPQREYSYFTFGIVSLLTGIIHLKLSAFSSHQHPFTFKDYTLIMSSFTLIFLFLLLFLKLFFNLKTKFILVVSIIYFTATFYLNVILGIHYLNRQLILILNLIITIAILLRLYNNHEFKFSSKIIVLMGFSVFILLSVLDLIYDLRRFHFIMTPLGAGIAAIAISLFIVIWLKLKNQTDELKNHKLKLLELEQQNLISQMNSLKEQIDPHFLFNNLNTLASLIETNSEKASIFIEELSKMYRFVLQTKKQELIYFQEELEFTESYIYLLLQRFGNYITINKEIIEDHLQYLIPPLCLQILIENAVKHNIVSCETPLYISIITKDDYLIVRNSINLKKSIRNSTKIGLENLKKRISFFTDKEVTIIQTEKIFEVKIPFIKEIK